MVRLPLLLLSQRPPAVALESFPGLDDLTGRQREILTRLRPILRERTSILVSHRVAAVKEADQILEVEPDLERRETREIQRITRFLERVGRHFPVVDYLER